MGIFAEWRERYGFIKLLVNAQKTIWYPILFAILCIISGVNNYTVYIPIMWGLVAIVLFSILFTDDHKVFFPPLCMIFFALGSDAAKDAFYKTNGDFLANMHPSALGHIIAMGIIAVGAFLVRLILDGSIAAAFQKKRHFTFGIIAMDIALLLNGIFSPSYDIANLGFGAMTAAVLTLVYFVVCGMIEKSSEPIKYACISMLCASYVALIQILIVIYRLNLVGLYYTKYTTFVYINRNAITLGWGVSTVIGAVFVAAIPAAMYLASNHKASLISFLSCPVLILGTVLIASRGSMLFGAIIFMVLSILCCIKGRNKIAIRIYVSILACMAIGVGMFVISKRPDLLSGLERTFRLSLNSDSGRNELWNNGIADFLRQSIFGVGFADGGYPAELQNNNFYSNMYHCILVQWLGAMGIIGAIAFLWHMADNLRLILKNFSLNKLLLLGVPMTIIVMSLVDNFFFYPHFQIFYAIFLSLAEYLHNSSTKLNQGAT